MKKTLRLLSLCALLMVVITACAPISAPQGEAAGSEERVLDVFAAASLKEAFDALGQEFAAANPGVTIVANLAGSQALASQLAEGAPADVFASADARQMQNAVDAGRIEAGAPQVFARNKLVVVLPADNPAGLDDLSDLAQPGLKLVIAAEAVPVGRYTLQFLANASATPTYTAEYSATVLANVASFEDNVRSVLNKVALGEADAGIVYTTDAASEAGAGLGAIAIPDELNVVASYPIAPVSDAHLPELAQAFVDLILSPAGQETLAEFGFLPANP